jgi:hypothetical protein
MCRIGSFLCRHHIGNLDEGTQTVVETPIQGRGVTVEVVKLGRWVVAVKRPYLPIKLHGVLLQ